MSLKELGQKGTLVSLNRIQCHIYKKHIIILLQINLKHLRHYILKFYSINLTGCLYLYQ